MLALKKVPLKKEKSKRDQRKTLENLDFLCIRNLSLYKSIKGFGVFEYFYQSAAALINLFWLNFILP